MPAGDFSWLTVRRGSLAPQWQGGWWRGEQGLRESPLSISLPPVLYSWLIFPFRRLSH